MPLPNQKQDARSVYGMKLQQTLPSKASSSMLNELASARQALSVLEFSNLFICLQYQLDKPLADGSPSWLDELVKPASSYKRGIILMARNKL